MGLKVIDLFSGLGGFSEAFVQDPEWDVLRIENNPLLSDVPHTLIWSALTLSPSEFMECDLLLASPPCTEFSQAYDAPAPRAKRAGIDFQPNMDLVKCALRWNEVIKPRYFLMENVNGSQKHFIPAGARLIQKTGPFVFYGNFPKFSMPPRWEHLKKENDTWSSDPLRANKKGKLPLELSSRIKETFERTTSILEWV